MKALVSVKVADGQPEAPVQVLVLDLARMLHKDAVAEYGDRGPACHHHVYCGELGGRPEFEGALLEDIQTPPEQAATYLAEWDAASRPVASIHYWMVP